MEVKGHALEGWVPPKVHLPPPNPLCRHLPSAEVWEETDPFPRWAHGLRDASAWPNATQTAELGLPTWQNRCL